MKKRKKLKVRFKKLFIFYVFVFLLVVFARCSKYVFAASEVNIVFNEAELVSGVSAGGYVQLGDNIDLTNELVVSTNVTLDLNGYMLRQTKSGASVINGENLNGKTLTIEDSRSEENIHYFFRKEKAAWQLVLTPEEGIEYEAISGGIITGGYNTTTSGGRGGGAIELNSGTDYVVINGGTIVGNYAARAGGASYGGVLTLNNGRICGNAAGQFAGAIALSGNFTMNGGIIEDNYSPPGTNQYNFYITGLSIGSSSNFVMTDGVIKDNIATVTSGKSTTLKISNNAKIIGNIYLQNGINASISGGEIIGRIRMVKGSFSMSGGKISGGIADNTEINYFGSNGGAVSVEGGNFQMTGGIITESSANLNGGGVYVNGGTFVMDGGIISNNSSTTGGGFYVNSGNVTILSGDIENNESLTNGGGIAIGGSGALTMSGGTIKNNVSKEGNGGGIYISDGNITINNGVIKENKAIHSSNGVGGGICVASGSIIMHDGVIEGNEAINGGGFYLTNGTFEIKNGSLVTKNKATNGAGGYVQNGMFNLTGGTTSNNIATLNGGGYYIVDTTTATLSNGIISNNEAKNGGGFYQTQTNGNSTSTTLSGTCYVNNNKTVNGNGGGVYVDGGSTFRIISGKLIYNNATGTFNENDIKTNGMVYAKDSSAGVGGGVYIKHGIFTMKNEDGTNGTAAIFGNVASYAADDLFANGNGMTTFDAIPVITMEKDDAYLTSTDWFEDYPKDENHMSLRISDNDSYLISGERYKNITNENLLVKADSVLATSYDYICITMGANVGTIILNVGDSSVGSDNTFIYTLVNEDSGMKINLSVKQGVETEIINLPIGVYRLTLNDKWSWRYTDQFIATINSGSETITTESANSIVFNVVGGKTFNIITKYNPVNKIDLSKTIFKKVPLDFNLNFSEDS